MNWYCTRPKKVGVVLGAERGWGSLRLQFKLEALSSFGAQICHSRQSAYSMKNLAPFLSPVLWSVLSTLSSPLS